MAQKKRNLEYQTAGSAAYEPAYYTSRESTARPLEQPEQQPQRRPRPKKRPVIHQKMAVAPFAVVGLGVALLMLVLVIFGYSQVYESATQVGEMEDLVAELQEENSKLQNLYDSSINLEQIETRARELGMQQPSAKQIVTLHLPAQDTAVVSRKAATNPFQAAWEAIVETARGLWEYLR